MHGARLLYNSDTAGERWRRQRRTELDRDELSVGVTRHKTSKLRHVDRERDWETAGNTDCHEASNELEPSNCI